MIAIATRLSERNMQLHGQYQEAEPSSNKVTTPLEGVQGIRAMCRKGIIALICLAGIIVHGTSFIRESKKMRAMPVEEYLEFFQRNNALPTNSYLYDLSLALRSNNPTLLNAGIHTMNFGAFQQKMQEDPAFRVFILTALENERKIAVQR